MLTLFNYLVLSGIFAGGFVLFSTPFTFYVNYGFMFSFLVMWLFSGHKLYLNKHFLLFLVVFFVLALFNVFLKNNTFPTLFKQVSGFIFNGTAYYVLIKANKGDISKLFKIYLKLAVIAAVIGIFQEISFLADFADGYDYSYFIPNFRLGGTVLGILRVSSVLPEPAHFGGAMAPAIFISVLNIMKNEANFISRKISFVIIVSALLTFSLITYVGSILALILIVGNYRRIKLIITSLSVLLALAIFSYKYVSEIRIRVDDTYAVVTGNAVLIESNLSTFAFLSNAAVAVRSFKNNPLFGSGIGSHSVSYDRYIFEVIDSEQDTMILNKEDAGSLFFRLMSETGLLGILGFLYFIKRFYVSRKRDQRLWIVSNSIACLFLINLIRLGNFFYCGFMFFVWAYYFANKNATALHSIPQSEQIDNTTFAKGIL